MPFSEKDKRHYYKIIDILNTAPFTVPDERYGGSSLTIIPEAVVKDLHGLLINPILDSEPYLSDLRKFLNHSNTRRMTRLAICRHIFKAELPDDMPIVNNQCIEFSYQIFQFISGTTTALKLSKLDFAFSHLGDIRMRALGWIINDLPIAELKLSHGVHKILSNNIFCDNIAESQVKSLDLSNLYINQLSEVEFNNLCNIIKKCKITEIKFNFSSFCKIFQTKSFEILYEVLEKSQTNVELINWEDNKEDGYVESRTYIDNMKVWEEKAFSTLQSHPSLAIAMMNAIPPDTTYFNEARFCIFRFVYNNYLNNDASNKQEAFLTALDICKHDNKLIKFADSDQRLFDSILAEACNESFAPAEDLMTDNERNKLIQELIYVTEKCRGYVKTYLKREADLKNSNDIELINDLRKAFFNLDNEPSEDILRSIVLLNQFKNEKNKKSDERHYKSAYKESINSFYSEGLKIILSDNSHDNKKTALKQLAVEKFHHQHPRYKLLKDALMIIGTIFLGAGLAVGFYRMAKGKTFFYSTDTTKRSKDLQANVLAKMTQS